MQLMPTGSVFEIDTIRMETKTRHSANIRRVSVLSARRRQPSAASSENLTGASEDDGHVRVAVRCRPMSDKELSAGYEPIVDFESEQRIVVHDVSEQPSDQLGTKSGERRNVSHVYDFDYVFDCNSKQQEIYDKVCRPIVSGVLEGYNGTIFAYGQTGTGKTHTMEGQATRQRLQEASERKRRASSTTSDRRRSSGGSSSKQLLDDRRPSATKSSSGCDQAGIIPRTFEQIFDHVQSRPEVQFLIRASYLEVYQEEIRDLLRKDKTGGKLELHERPDIGVYVKDLTSFVCKSISEIERVMRVGNQNRIVGATDMNEHSSRSHAIFMITIEQQQQQPQIVTKLQQAAAAAESDKPDQQLKQQKPLKQTNQEVQAIRVGKLNLVDLAGSERQRKTNSLGQRQKESIKINSSLSALGNVINSLMKLQKKREQTRDLTTTTTTTNANINNGSVIHTPYRDSKLTRLLQDSLGGNARTLMIANIGPASYNYDETINTLNYASRARCIKNRPRVNEDPKDALLRELQHEIELLRTKLAASKQGVAANECDVGGRGDQQMGDNQSSVVLSAKSSRGSDRRYSLTLVTGKQPIINDNNSSSNNNPKQLLVEREFFELKQKLASLECKLLNSDKFDLMAKTTASQSAVTETKQVADALDHQSLLKGLTREQGLELERRQEELANQVGREQAIRDELERRVEAELLAKQSFQSIQQEIEAKRRLIWQVLLKVKSIRDEMGSTQRAYRTELDELEQLQFVLQRELKLKCLIMDNFIPNDHVEQLIARVNYDERRNVCSIKPLDLPAIGQNNQGCVIAANAREHGATKCLLDYLAIDNSMEGRLIRPRSELERLGETINPSNIRYKSENLIECKPTLLNFGCTRRGPILRPSMGVPHELIKSRKLCDILSERVDKADSVNESRGDTLNEQLQALISDALDQREPDIVI